MRPVEPTHMHVGGTRVVYAQDQPEYESLPASVDPAGVVMTEWELTAEELAVLLFGGRVRLWIHTFGKPLQPLRLEVALPVNHEGEQWRKA